MKIATILENASKVMFENATGEEWDAMSPVDKQIRISNTSRILHHLMDAGLKVDQDEDPIIVGPHDTLADETRFITEIAADLHVQLGLESVQAVERAEELYYETKERVGQRYM